MGSLRPAVAVDLRVSAGDDPVLEDARHPALGARRSRRRAGHATDPSYQGFRHHRRARAVAGRRVRGVHRRNRGRRVDRRRRGSAGSWRPGRCDRGPGRRRDGAGGSGLRPAGEAGAAVAALLEPEGLLDDPASVVLAREIRREGRNLARINGRTVALSLQRQVGELLVDVHGQSEHLSLLRVQEHLHLLDRFAGDDKADRLCRRGPGAGAGETGVGPAASGSAAMPPAVGLPGLHREGDRGRPAAAGREGFAGGGTDPPGECRATGRIDQRSPGCAGRGPAGTSAGSCDQLAAAVEAVDRLARVDPSLAEVDRELQAAAEQLVEVARRLRRYREGLEANPQRLTQVEDRLGLIHDLERKFGGGEAAVLSQLERARQELESIKAPGERISASNSRRHDASKRWVRRQGNFRRATRHHRQVGAGDRGRAGRPADDRHRRGSAVGRRPGRRHGRWAPCRCSPDAFDRIEFLVAPNPGEEIKPLAKIASGGETSRLMLALKGVLAQADRTPTLIFDEIDQGIGGRVGGVVGEGVAPGAQPPGVVYHPSAAAGGLRRSAFSGGGNYPAHRPHLHHRRPVTRPGAIGGARADVRPPVRPIYAAPPNCWRRLVEQAPDKESMALLGLILAGCAVPPGPPVTPTSLPPIPTATGAGPPGPDGYTERVPGRPAPVRAVAGRDDGPVCDRRTPAQPTQHRRRRVSRSVRGTRGRSGRRRPGPP